MKKFLVLVVTVCLLQAIQAVSRRQYRKLRQLQLENKLDYQNDQTQDDTNHIDQISDQSANTAIQRRLFPMKSRIILQRYRPVRYTVTAPVHFIPYYKTKPKLRGYRHRNRPVYQQPNSPSQTHHRYAPGDSSHSDQLPSPIQPQPQPPTQQPQVIPIHEDQVEHHHDHEHRPQVFIQETSQPHDHSHHHDIINEAPQPTFINQKPIIFHSSIPSDVWRPNQTYIVTQNPQQPNNIYIHAMQPGGVDTRPYIFNNIPVNPQFFRGINPQEPHHHHVPGVIHQEPHHHHASGVIHPVHPVSHPVPQPVPVPVQPPVLRAPSITLNPVPPILKTHLHPVLPGNPFIKTHLNPALPNVFAGSAPVPVPALPPTKLIPTGPGLQPSAPGFYVPSGPGFLPSGFAPIPIPNPFLPSAPGLLPNFVPSAPGIIPAHFLPNNGFYHPAFFPGVKTLPLQPSVVKAASSAVEHSLSATFPRHNFVNNVVPAVALPGSFPFNAVPQLPPNNLPTAVGGHFHGKKK